MASIDLTNGAWADEQTKVLTVVQPTRLRFHASGLQTDLGVLQDGLEARIVPPTPTATGTSVPYDSTMSGILRLSDSPVIRMSEPSIYTSHQSSWLLGREQAYQHN